MPRMTMMKTGTVFGGLALAIAVPLLAQSLTAQAATSPSSSISTHESTQKAKERAAASTLTHGTTQKAKERAAASTLTHESTQKAKERAAAEFTRAN
jgi:uncharacterized protein YoaH (UPF0181 family)